ncbi:PfaD family polyunsaturated fatty acid/polyketide biosynthesis protein [Actinomadura fulvescens]|uniref:PfaD family polyunsaturated fatty acid/polyketide biosynthesis protein n=1 Tax=Actinomadura fulvescens TaxID=46160 RepID=A0ABN3PY55_9ACTN
MTAVAAPPPTRAPRLDPDGIYGALADLTRPCMIVRTAAGIGATNSTALNGGTLLAAAAPAPPERFGDPAFLRAHGVRQAYMAGAMAGGIASADLVIALARAGLLGSFGAAGLLPDRTEQALLRFQREIPGLPYCCNLIHSPSEEALERATVDLYLRHRVRSVEAAAYLDLTPHIVRYRAAGLARGRDGATTVANRVMAKVSRAEVADRFLRPPPDALLAPLAAAGLITAEQAALARTVPVADDITAEADSGGHTDRRSLTTLLPALLRLRDVRAPAVRVGAAGGIGDPYGVAAAFAMGADYVVTGSVNQCCTEAGTSAAAKAMLAEAGVADCEMAPAADMFEMGVQVQVLKKACFFPVRAAQLHQIYMTYPGIEAIPADVRRRLETQTFQRPLAEVWADTVRYFEERDPAQIERALDDPKRRMALIFRWYLGMASRWATSGRPDRTVDYQLWCGPAMGAFNDWVRGSSLEPPAARQAAVIAHHLMTGAAFLNRVAQLRLAGVRLPPRVTTYRLPKP